MTLSSDGATTHEFVFLSCMTDLKISGNIYFQPESGLYLGRYSSTMHVSTYHTHKKNKNRRKHEHGDISKETEFLTDGFPTS